MTLGACYCPYEQARNYRPDLTSEYIRRYFSEKEGPDPDSLETHRDNTANRDYTRSSIMKIRPRERGRRRQEQPRNMHNFKGVLDNGFNDDFRNTELWELKRAAEKRHLSKMVNQGFNGNWVQWAKGLGYQQPAKNSGANPDWFLPIFTRQTWKGSASNENSHRAGYGYYGMTNPGGRPLAPTDP